MVLEKNAHKILHTETHGRHAFTYNHNIGYLFMDYEEVRDFAELDLSIVDFKNPEWSWGFVFDQDHGEIRHCTDCGHLTIYKIPDCIAEIIVEHRTTQTEIFKRKLRELRRQEKALLD